MSPPDDLALIHGPGTGVCDAPTEVIDPDADRPKEACGVFAVRAPGRAVAHLTYLGLYALQHRGQESAGMAVSDREHLTVTKDMGLVSHVFDDRTLAALDGELTIGHTRYSTTGSSEWWNAQPVYRSTGDLNFALGHNGNLTNTAALAAETATLPGTISSDTDLMAELLAGDIEVQRNRGVSDDELLVEAVCAVAPRMEGAFSLVLMDNDRVIGVRDPNGFRPLVLGSLGDDWVLASETAALDVVGATLVREIAPGEVVVIDDDGPQSHFPFAEDRINPTLCLFEFVYFARPDTFLGGRGVHQARVRMGEVLSTQQPVEADMVMGVPESGIPAAEGYARASGIPFGQGLVKNRYIGRTFIAPTQEVRALGVRMKLNPLRDTIEGQRLVVVDDSIVRGTTTKAMVAMLFDAGAAEVHMRVSSPPYRWPCYYGMDTGARETLLAANMTVPEIEEYLGVDSLVYLELDKLLAAVGPTPGTDLDPADQFCAACLTGHYPVEIPVNLGKHVLEQAPTPVTSQPTLYDDVVVSPVGVGS